MVSFLDSFRLLVGEFVDFSLSPATVRGMAPGDFETTGFVSIGVMPRTVATPSRQTPTPGRRASGDDAGDFETPGFV
jgi:hypothetical protein